jgi:hypothetical protein
VRVCRVCVCVYVECVCVCACVVRSKQKPEVGKVQVKQSHYRSGQALRVPGG